MPTAWNVHPEFGFLCLSARFRRRLQLGLFCAAGLLIAGIVSSNIFFAEDAGDARRAFALAPTRALHTEEAVRVGPVERVVSTDGRASPQGSTDRGSSRLCSAGALLDRTCTFGEARKMRRVRSLSEPPALARFLIGHGSAPAMATTDTTPPSGTDGGENEAISSSIELAPAAEQTPAQSPQPPRTSTHAEGGKRHHAATERHAHVQGLRTVPTARTAWGSLW